MLRSVVCTVDEDEVCFCHFDVVVVCCVREIS